MTVGILIADDHELVRRGIISQLAAVQGWKILAEAVNGREAVTLALELKPDLIVLDMSMPELNGLAAARQILSVEPAARILLLTVHESEQLVREALAAGILGYLLKSDTASTLVHALREILAGRPYLNSRISRVVIGGFVRASTEASGGASLLSAREQEIVQLLAEGKSNKEVAQALDISVKTAETHRGNIMRKAGFGSLAELVRYAIRNGLIPP